MRVGRIGASSLIPRQKAGHKWLLPGLASFDSLRSLRMAPPFDSPRGQSSLPALHYLTTFDASRENRTPVLTLGRSRHTTRPYSQHQHHTIPTPKLEQEKMTGLVSRTKKPTEVFLEKPDI